MAKVSGSYTASDVKKLTTQEAFQQKIGMYAGGAGLGVEDNTGVVKCFLEILDNSIDEALNGYGNIINIIINSQGKLASYTVSDEGRGIPIDRMEDGQRALEVLLTDSHAGGKHSDSTNYKTSGGTNGIGASMVNALSTKFVAISQRDGKKVTIQWKEGIKTNEEEVAATGKKTGTTIMFQPSFKFFTETDDLVIPEEKIIELVRQRAFLNAGIKFVVTYNKNATTFCYNSIADYISYICNEEIKDKLVHNNAIIIGKVEKEIVTTAKKAGSCEAEIIFGFSSKFDGEAIHAFCNTIEQKNGGTHVQGFKMGLPRCAIKFINDNAAKYLKGKFKSLEVAGPDVSSGLIAVISIKHSSPIYSSQDKSKVTNNDIQGITQSLVSSTFTEWLQKGGPAVDAVVNRILKNAYLRKSAESAKTRVNKEEEKMMSLGKAEKLADCISRTNNEIIFCEGDSAAGTLKAARDKTYQAIMPMSGKILNVQNLEGHRILKSEKIKEILCAIGADLSSTNINVDKLNYDRYVILADADSDGRHIVCILITLFNKLGQQLFADGRVFVAIPPLYRIVFNNGKVEYCEDDVKLISYLINRILTSKQDIKGKTTGVNIGKSELTMLFRVFEKVYDALYQLCNKTCLNVDVVDSILTKILNDKKSDEIKISFSSLIKTFLKKENPEFYKEDGEYISGLFNGEMTIVKLTPEFDSAMAEILNYYHAIGTKLGNFTYSIDGEVYSLLSTFKKVKDIANNGFTLTYLKGLGEMGAEEMAQTTISMSNRKMYQLKLSSEQEVAQVIGELMGKSGESYRTKAVIEKFCKEVNV